MTEQVADDERGWLVTEGDEATMALRIIDMAHDSAARARNGSAARSYTLASFSRAAVHPKPRRTIGLEL